MLSQLQINYIVLLIFYVEGTVNENHSEGDWIYIEIEEIDQPGKSKGIFAYTVYTITIVLFTIYMSHALSMGFRSHDQLWNLHDDWL